MATREDLIKTLSRYHPRARALTHAYEIASRFEGIDQVWKISEDLQKFFSLSQEHADKAAKIIIKLINFI